MTKFVESDVAPKGTHGITATEPDRVNADSLGFSKKGRKPSNAA